ncbi:hypothetical protein [Glaciimonas immobilis]|uniref:Uncharacterized protein n=1 Tax=Glaciimonas immobilis TaxID=728004 RepID=A0A840RTE7_9BURK|nr:hypothetical protein [Glaciimonas immobilis]KAF3997102.1 hypothetical protein HAV38_15680 [Glaciimonas immobilis]MBB5199964.1 hypothetical protein [Glaciimonas immobilis]
MFVSPHNFNVATAADREPRPDFSRSTAAEVGKYAVNYLKTHIRDSFHLRALRRQDQTVLIQQQSYVYLCAGTYNKFWHTFTTENFIDHTDGVRSRGIGHSVDICMLAARVIVENGYPGPVHIYQINGDAEGFVLHHVFLFIHVNRKSSSAESHMIDPLIQMLSEDEQKSLIGATQPQTFVMDDCVSHLYCMGLDEKTGEGRFLSLPDISKLGMGPVATVSLDADSKIQYFPYPV